MRNPTPSTHGRPALAAVVLLGLTAGLPVLLGVSAPNPPPTAATTPAPAPAAATLLPATLRRLVEIEQAHHRLEEQASSFRDQAGPDRQRVILETVKQGCQERRVLRLDDIEESRSGRAADAAPPKNAPLPLLLDLDFSRDGLTAVVAGERGRSLPVDAHVLTLSDGQVHTRQPLAMARSDIGSIEIEARSDRPAFLLVGWSDRDDVALMHRDKVRVDLRGDGRSHLYTIDATKALERGLADDAVLRRLFLSGRGEGDGKIEVTHVRLLSRKQRYLQAVSGVTYEEVGGQLRRSLWQRTPSSVAFDVTVPDGPSVLETGIAVLGSDEPVEVEVVVESASKSTTLIKRLVEPGRWRDVSLDLGPWSGLAISLRLSARGLPGAVALWSSPTVRPVKAEGASPPPIFVVLEDALRADRLSVYGGPVPAPAHQRLADAGTVFERAFSQATQTRSSVPSLMTSLPPSATGTWDFSDSLREEYVTLAEMLRTCGYATASFIQNGNAGVYAGLHQGFEVVFDEKNNGLRAADLLGGDVRGWIDAHKERPFFVYLHILDPHGPFDPPSRPPLPAADGGTAVEFDRAIDPPWLTSPTAEIRRALYEAEVAANDAALGNFWDWLEARGLFSRSVIALLADHGEYLGDGGGLWRHHPPSRLEVARVPLLLAGPGLPNGRRESVHVGLIDVTPTLLEAAGVPAAPFPAFGRSLVSLLSGAPWPDRALLVEEPGLERGERNARGCGSLLLSDVQLLLPCVGEAGFLPRREGAPPPPPVEPLRVVGLGADDYGKQQDVGFVAAALLESRARDLLRDVQAADIEGWKRMTGGSSAAIRSEPQTDERLRSLGYLE